MKRFILGLTATLLTASPAIAQQTPPPATRPSGGGAHILTYLLAPIVGLAEIQAKLSPEKPSCWNDGATEVAGCRIVDKLAD